jgi:hypothetical protein
VELMDVIGSCDKNPLPAASNLHDFVDEHSEPNGFQ